MNFLASSSSGSNQELSTPKEQQKGGETVVTAANGPQLLESAAEEKRPSKTLAHIETPRSSSSHHVSAQTKSSMHRRTNGVVSVFFSPENTYTLEVEKEGQIFLHALSAQQNHTTGKQRSTERTARSLSPVSPRHLQHQDGLKQGWRLKAGTTPDVMRRIPIVTCESQEIDMSPMMPDDYIPAITYQRVFNGPGAGEYVRRTMQRASRKKHISKKERPLAQADQHAVGPSGYSDGDKMKHTMRYLRHPRDSVNINLLDDLNKDAKDSPQRKSTTKDKRQITGFNASGDSDELMSSYLPMCSRQAQWRSFNGRNGRPARR